jgi:hypothetical protein
LEHLRTTISKITAPGNKLTDDEEITFGLEQRIKGSEQTSINSYLNCQVLLA